MRDKQLVNVTNAALPQVGRDFFACQIRAADGAGVINDDMPAGGLDNCATTVADRQEGAAKFLGPQKAADDKETEKQPKQGEHTEVCRARFKPGHGNKEKQAQIPNP